MSVSLETLAIRRWLRSGGAIVLFVVALAACSQSAALPTGTAPAGSSGAQAISQPPVAPGELLAAVLEPLRSAAAFETRVEVDGTEVVSATGRSVGAASEVRVTTSGRTVEYVRIPPRAWAREPSGSWVLLGSDAAPAAPLDVLSQPLTLDVAAGLPGATSFRATYPAAALGLEGEPVTVTVSIDGASVTFRYEATASGRQTSSVTTLHPGTPDPIVAPVVSPAP